MTNPNKLFDTVERGLPILVLLVAMGLQCLWPSTDRVFALLFAIGYVLAYQMVLEYRKDRVEKYELDSFRSQWESRRSELWSGLNDMKHHREATDKALAELQLDTKTRIEGLGTVLNRLVGRVG